MESLITQVTTPYYFQCICKRDNGGENLIINYAAELTNSAVIDNSYYSCYNEYQDHLDYLSSYLNKSLLSDETLETLKYYCELFRDNESYNSVVVQTLYDKTTRYNEYDYQTIKEYMLTYAIK